MWNGRKRKQSKTGSRAEFRNLRDKFERVIDVVVVVVVVEIISYPTISAGRVQAGVARGRCVAAYRYFAVDAASSYRDRRVWVIDRKASF